MLMGSHAKTFRDDMESKDIKQPKLWNQKSDANQYERKESKSEQGHVEQLG
jgi:hypothetical protein